MKTNKYLEKVLEQESLSNDCTKIKNLRKEREKVDKLLINYFEASYPSIRYGGSKAKGTMIKESYDLDIICYFEHDDNKAGNNLSEIYDNTVKALEKDYFIFRKTSAIRLHHKDEINYKLDYHIDVVPGRFVDSKNEDAYIHQHNGDKDHLKTNIQKHIEYIKDSGLQNIIKLVKLWNIRTGLKVKTFILELLVVKILSGSKSLSLDNYLIEFWQTLKDDIDNFTIEDPANPNGNDLSKLFDKTLKLNLSFAAQRSLDLVNKDKWTEIFGEVKDEDSASKIATIEAANLKYKNPVKPWADI